MQSGEHLRSGHKHETGGGGGDGQAGGGVSFGKGLGVPRL